MRRFWPLLLILGGAGIGVLGATLVSGRTTPDQPIAFNHRIHMDDLGMECSDCHQHVFSGQRATIPNVAECTDCHEEAQTESPDELLLVASVASGEPIPWLRVTWVPDDVYFSHRRHTAIAQIPCEDCHGEVGLRAQPLTKPLLRLTMDGCIDCHEQSGVTNDCITCHR